MVKEKTVNFLILFLVCCFAIAVTFCAMMVREGNEAWAGIFQLVTGETPQARELARRRFALVKMTGFDFDHLVLEPAAGWALREGYGQDINKWESWYKEHWWRIYRSPLDGEVRCFKCRSLDQLSPRPSWLVHWLTIALLTILAYSCPKDTPFMSRRSCRSFACVCVLLLIVHMFLVTKARSVWNENIDLANHQWCSGEGVDCARAVSFLVNLTGIMTKTAGWQYPGFIFLDGFDQELATWNVWYREHWWRVYWDPIVGEVNCFRCGTE